MNKRFTMGFSIGLFIFIMINLLAAHLASDCSLLAVFGHDSPWHRAAYLGTARHCAASPSVASGRAGVRR